MVIVCTARILCASNTMVGMKKSQLYYALGLILGLLILVVVQLPSRIAKMVACDVGQGDAILITKGNNQVLIDGGPSGEKVLKCLAEHVPFWDRNIELIVLTNTDFDHINGLSTVLERYSLTEFVTADGVHETAALSRFVKVLAEHKVAAKMVEQGDTIKVGVRDNLDFEVLWPPHVNKSYLAVFSTQTGSAEREQILGASAKGGDFNERSVVLLLTEGNYKVMLTGDSGFQAEEGMMKAGKLQDIDLLKVGHHGSKYASSEDFLAIIKPEIAVISVGEKNRYGHPTDDTMARLRGAGAKILRTDELGTMVLELGE